MSTLRIVAPEAATIGTLAAVKSHSSKTYAMSSHKREGPHEFRRLFVQLLRGDPRMRPVMGSRRTPIDPWKLPLVATALMARSRPSLYALRSSRLNSSLIMRSPGVSLRPRPSRCRACWQRSVMSAEMIELSFLQWIGAHPLRREHKVAHQHPELVLRRPRLEEPVLIPITGATGGRRPRARWRATR